MGMFRKIQEVSAINFDPRGGGGGEGGSPRSAIKGHKHLTTAHRVWQTKLHLEYCATCLNFIPLENLFGPPDAEFHGIGLQPICRSILGIQQICRCIFFVCFSPYMINLNNFLDNILVKLFNSAKNFAALFIFKPST